VIVKPVIGREVTTTSGMQQTTKVETRIDGIRLRTEIVVSSDPRKVVGIRKTAKIKKKRIVRGRRNLHGWKHTSRMTAMLEY